MAERERLMLSPLWSSPYPNDSHTETGHSPRVDPLAPTCDEQQYEDEHDLPELLESPQTLDAATTTTPCMTSSSVPSGQPSLPMPLQILFAANGFTLSLPSMAYMYIVNHRVDMPVSMLSTYGALAFLPFSLKPVYAVISNYPWLGQGQVIPRDTLITTLLVASGLSVIGTAYIPSEGVLLCFLLALARGVTSAWPEFLLGLTLLDHARQQDHPPRSPPTPHSSLLPNLSKEAQRTPSVVHSTSLDEITLDETTTPIPLDNQASTSHANEPISFESAATQFQAQAATALNLGSLAAHCLALIILADAQLHPGRKWSYKTSIDATGTVRNALNDRSVYALLSIAAFANLLSAIIAKHYRVGTRRTSPVDQYQPVDGSDFGSVETMDADIILLTTATSVKAEKKLAPQETNFELGSINQQQSQSVASTRDAPARTDGGFGSFTTSRPLNYETCGPSTCCCHSQQTRRESATLHTSHSLNQNRTKLYTLVLLQSVILLFALKAPINMASPNWVWQILALALAVGLIGSSCSCYRNVIWIPTSWTNVERTGLFLVLRHAMPSASYVVDSFLYERFAIVAPSFLQFQSLYGTFVTVIASWSFGKMWADGESRRKCENSALENSGYTKLSLIIAFTTAVAAAASLCNIPLIHQLGANKTLSTMNTMSPTLNVADTPTSSLSSWTFILALIVQSVVTITGYWSFLPDVVLATISVKVSDSNLEHIKESRLAARLHCWDDDEQTEGICMDDSIRTPSMQHMQSSLDDDSRHVCRSASAQTDESCHHEVRTLDAAVSNSMVDKPTWSSPTESHSVEDLRYGALLSCLDFGDQLGALLTSPLVSWLGTERDNDWKSLDSLVTYCALGMLLSIGFLRLLR